MQICTNAIVRSETSLKIYGIYDSEYTPTFYRFNFPL